MTPKTLLVVTRHYFPEPTGSGPVMRLLAEWIAASGRFEVEVLTVRPSYPATVITPGYADGERDRAVEGGVRVVRFPTKPIGPGGVLKRVGPEANFMARLLAGRATGAIRPSSTVLSLCPSILTVIGALPLKRRGGRHVAIVHDIQSGLGGALGLGHDAPVIRVLRWLEAWSLNRVDHMVVLSAEMEASLREIGVRTPCTIMPPQIDLDAVRPLPFQSGRPPTLMYSGNLGRKQGLDQVIDLAAVLVHEAPSIRILIRGDGPLRDALVERCVAEQLTNVVFEPLVDVNMISQSLAEADIHLVPQISEGKEFSVPSKAYSIMAAARPFIATAEPGSPLSRLAEDSGASVCVPPRDARAFAATVRSLLDDRTRLEEMGRNGRRYIEAEMSRASVIERMEGLLA